MVFPPTEGTWQFHPCVGTWYVEQCVDSSINYWYSQGYTQSNIQGHTQDVIVIQLDEKRTMAPTRGALSPDEAFTAPNRPRPPAR